MISIEPIGHVLSPFKEKFATPKQTQLTRDVEAVLCFPFSKVAPDAFDHISDFNFYWLTCLFHQAHSTTKVRPPRLGGNEKIGVFATRSPFRPNPISLSLVEFVRYQQNEQQSLVTIKGIDLVDGTPILDLKPYIAEHDSPWAEVKRGWLEGYSDTVFDVRFLEQTHSVLEQFPKLRNLLVNIFKSDPRPQYHQDQSEKIYHAKVDQFDIHFQVFENEILILDITIFD